MGSGSGSGSGPGSSNDPDSDGDGVPDVADNCESVGNGDQRDHDGDALGDACDGCPHLVDTGKDADFDGVGDACDPRPTAAGDRIAFFEGFYAGPPWKTVIGANTWQAVNGTLRQGNMDTAYQLVRDDTPDLTTLFVDARVRVDAISSNFTLRRATGIVLSFRDADHYLFCGLAALPQGAEVHAARVSTDFLGNARYDYAPGAFPAQMAGDWLRLQARTSKVAWGNTRIECVGHRVGATGTTSFESDADIDGDVGIRTSSADASFDYVFVVATPAASS